MTTGICCVPGLVFEAPADLEAVHVRHHDVEQNEIALGPFADRPKLPRRSSP